MQTKNYSLRCRATITAAILLAAGYSVQSAALLDVGVFTFDDASYGFGISASDRCVGVSRDTTNGGQRGFCSQPGAALQSTCSFRDNLLCTLSSSFTEAIAFDIAHSSGETTFVVGEAYWYDYSWWPFVYWENSSGQGHTALVLELAGGGTPASAQAVVKTGDTTAKVVGYSGTAACYWEIWSTTSNLVYSHAFHANSLYTDTDGTRHVGYHSTNANWRAYIHDSGTNYDLPVPTYAGYTATNTYALGISTSGSTSLIVGYAEFAPSVRPMLWRYTGSGAAVAKDLVPPYPKNHGIAYGIDGTNIVGSAWTNTRFQSYGYNEVAARYETNGSGFTLSHADATLIRAYKVNGNPTDRKIVGICKLASDNAIRAFRYKE